jgi:hypothetical protein
VVDVSRRVLRHRHDPESVGRTLRRKIHHEGTKEDEGREEDSSPSFPSLLLCPFVVLLLEKAWMPGSRASRANIGLAGEAGEPGMTNKVVPDTVRPQS